LSWDWFLFWDALVHTADLVYEFKSQRRRQDDLPPALFAGYHLCGLFSLPEKKSELADLSLSRDTIKTSLDRIV
jgi:hypothetical protein